MLCCAIHACVFAISLILLHVFRNLKSMSIWGLYTVVCLVHVVLIVRVVHLSFGVLLPFVLVSVRSVWGALGSLVVASSAVSPAFVRLLFLGPRLPLDLRRLGCCGMIRCRRSCGVAVVVWLVRFSARVVWFEILFF